jgi:valyl-tRNA synthetase
MNVPPGLAVEAAVHSQESRVRLTLEKNKEIVTNLAKLGALQVTSPGNRPPSCATTVYGDCTIFVSLKDIIDFNAEQERLSKEIAKIAKELGGVEKKLFNESFISKAPQDVVDGVRLKQALFLEKKENLEKHLAVVKQLATEG